MNMSGSVNLSGSCARRKRNEETLALKQPQEQVFCTEQLMIRTSVAHAQQGQTYRLIVEFQTSTHLHSRSLAPIAGVLGSTVRSTACKSG